MVKDTTRLFYLYKVKIGEKAYLGVGGAFDTTQQSLDPVVHMTMVHFDDEFDKDRIDELFARYLEICLKYLKEEKEDE